MTSVFLFIIGVAFRMVNFTTVFPGNGSFYLFDPDCYMRLRKVQVYLAAFPQPFVYDYFQGFPQGTGIISTPIMEYLLAALFFPLTGREIDEKLLAVVMALIPPLLGGVAVVLLYRLVREWFGHSAGLVAALLLACMPIHIEATLLGRFDNEMTEPLLLLLVLFYYLKTYRNDELRNWLILGILQALFVLTWRGALLPLSVLGVDILIRSLKPGERTLPLKAAASAYLLPAAIFSLICLTDLWGTKGVFSFNIVSWFHVYVFAVAGVVVSLSGSAAGKGRFAPAFITAAAIVAIGSAIFLVPSLRQGLQVAGGGDVWIDSINQYMPAYRDRSTIFSFGIFPIIAPLGVWFAWKNDRSSDLPRRFMVLIIAAFFLLALLRRRYGHFYAVEAVLAAGIAYPRLQSILSSRCAMSAGRAFGAILAMVLLLQLPTAAAFPSLSKASSGPLRGDLEEALLWLRNNTPSAGDPYRPDRKPFYSVLSNWDLGGYIETIARRPSVATSYGMETYGTEEAGRLFLSTDSDELAAVLKRNGSRYILLYNPIDKVEMYTRLLKVKNVYVVDKWDPVLRRYAYNPTPEALKLSIVRLFIADGSLVRTDGLSFDPLEGVRLVFESRTPAELGNLPMEVKQAKIFERTPGARVILPEIAGCRVIAEQQVETNQGRTFIYRNGGETTTPGNVSVTLPYPPKTGPGSVGAVGPAVVSCGGHKVTVAVSAEAVRAGSPLMLNW